MRTTEKAPMKDFDQRQMFHRVTVTRVTRVCYACLYTRAHLAVICFSQKLRTEKKGKDLSFKNLSTEIEPKSSCLDRGLISSLFFLRRALGQRKGALSHAKGGREKGERGCVPDPPQGL